MAQSVVTRSVKHYASDPMKEKVHDLLSEMLQRTLLTFRKPEEICVLHLAGIDAAETQRVYLDAGIPPRNITTLERDPVVAEAIEAKGLGINVVRLSLEEFVDRHRGRDIESYLERGDVLESVRPFKFDVVSMDFIGPVNDIAFFRLGEIVSNCYRDDILLHSANLLRRDRGNFSTYYQGLKMHNILDPEPIPDSDLAAPGNKAELKTTLYPHVVLGTVSPFLGTAGIRLYNFLISGADPDAPRELIRKLDAVVEAERMVDREYGTLDRMAVKDPKYIDAYVERIFSVAHDILHFQMSKTGSVYGTRMGPWTNNVYLSLVEAFTPGKDLYPDTSTSYSYISESASPMVGSIFHLTRDRYYAEAQMEVARACGFPNRFRIDPDRLARALLNLDKQAMRNRFLGKPEVSAPQFLGSSAKPVLSKRRFIEELENGRDIEWVRSTYRGCEGKPLAQWKAHHTMGTYSKDGQRPAPTPIETPEDRDIEKITKEEAYDLLASGIPAREVYNTYPTSFTMGQLNAFRAWITMRETKRTD